MTRTELRRRDLCRDVQSGSLTQVEAAARLGISDRQMRRLMREFERAGDEGLISKRRGKPSNRRLSSKFVDDALTLVSERYADFGPTFANEMLREHGIVLSTETLRQAMIREGLWTAKLARRAILHRPRERRAQFGELTQIDGSPHDWFEGRARRCTLIVFIDDATSSLVALHFAKSESIAAYMAALRQQLTNFGRPLTIYSDRHTIFRSTGAGLTQFGRALEQLDIEHVCANSPQAKGRVERVNRTLQQRLPKLLRLAGISDMDAANTFLQSYLSQHNERFARHPHNGIDAHRSAEGIALDDILAVHHQRHLSREATFQFGTGIYGIDTLPRFIASRTLTIIEQGESPFRVQLDGKTLAYHKLCDVQRPQIMDRKQIAEPTNRRIPNPKKAHAPPATHPWKQYPYRPLDRTSLLGADRT